MWRHFSTPHLHLLSGAAGTAESFVNNGVTLLDKLLILVPQASFFCIMLFKKKRVSVSHSIHANIHKSVNG